MMSIYIFLRILSGAGAVLALLLAPLMVLHSARRTRLAIILPGEPVWYRPAVTVLLFYLTTVWLGWMIHDLAGARYCAGLIDGLQAVCTLIFGWGRMQKK